MTALSDWDIVSDAELACAAAAGDRRAFAGIYDRYANRLHDFCVGMVRDRDAAADCVQDVFCTVAQRLPQLRHPDKLRPWLYAIARNESLRCIRERRREQVCNEVPETQSSDPGPDTLAARTELAHLVAEAAGGLSDRDRALLDLAYRHGLDGPELAQALGVSAGNANQMVHRLRQTIERSLGALLVARRAGQTGRCRELAAILDGWDGRFSVLMRKRVARHIESCAACEQERRRLVNPIALLGGAPALIPAPAWLRARTLNRVRLTSASSGTDATTRGHVARPGRPALVAALCVATLMSSLGLTMAWLHHRQATVVPAIGVSSDVRMTPRSAPALIVAPPTADASPSTAGPSTAPRSTAGSASSVATSGEPTSGAPTPGEDTSTVTTGASSAPGYSPRPGASTHGPGAPVPPTVVATPVVVPSLPIWVPPGSWPTLWSPPTTPPHCVLACAPKTGAVTSAAPQSPGPPNQ